MSGAHMEALSPDSFEFIGVIGQGSFGQVVRARKKDTNEILAIKIVEKSHLKKENKVKQAHVEKNILTKLRDHPGIIHLHYTFQDSQCLYFVLDLCEGGDLISLINSYQGNFPYELAVFYTAEIVSALEYLRVQHVAHRDLKPENVLVTSNGHLRLVDFGSARDYTNEEEKDAISRRNTFVGTAEYVSPEVLADQEVGPPVDLWALGCILYQMNSGHPPFSAKNDYLIFEQIRNMSITYPSSMPPDAVDLVKKLLIHNPRDRLGAGDAGSQNDLAALKAHPIFRSVNFPELFNLPVPGFVLRHPVQITPIDAAADTASTASTHASDLELLPILTGIVKKKAGWIYKQRRLEVTREPRIRYYELSTGALKGEIEVSADLRVDVRSQCEFHIVTPKRTYYFKEITADAARWGAAIATAVASLRKQ